MIIITPYGISKDRDRLRAKIKELLVKYEWVKGQDVTITNGPPEAETLSGEPRQFLFLTGTKFTALGAVTRILEPLGLKIVINHLDSDIQRPPEIKAYK